MKFIYKVNAEHKGNSSDKDRAIRAARKAALAVSSPRGVVHVEVLEVLNEEDPDAIEIVHRDMVLAENIKDLDTDKLTQIGMIIPGQFQYIPEKKKSVKEGPKFKIGDYLMVDGELHKIVTVSDTSARAQPVQKKKVKIKDKFTDKEREFAIHRRTVTLSASTSGVLTKEEVAAELKKIEEQEHVDSRSDIRDSAEGDRSVAQQPNEDSGDSGNSASDLPVPKRKRGRPKGWKKPSS